MMCEMRGDVDAAADHVGGHQPADLSLAEPQHHAVAGLLRQVAVDGVDGLELVRQAAVDLLRPPLGAAENDGLRGLLPLQQPHQQVVLLLGIDREVELLDGLHRQVLGGEIQRFRLPHVALGQPADRRRNGGAEEHRLPPLRATAEDLFDVGAEADVQHAVGLVEDDETQLAQHQRAAAHQVQDAAGGAHDQGGPLVELFGLFADGLAAVDGHDVDVTPLGQLGALVADLDG